MSIKLLTDSTADISQAEGKSRGITVIPLKITFGDETFYDNVNLDHDEFYDRLVGADELPTTSQPAPEEFLSVFEEAKKNGDSLICILLSGALSGTVQSALIARDICGYQHIHVVDSIQAVMGMRLLVDLAEHLIKDGCSVEEIVHELDVARHKVKLHTIVDTLTYLQKGGRVSSAVKIVGTLMKVKPILTIRDGALVVVGKGMGRKDAINKTLAMMSDLSDPDPRVPVYFGYTQNQTASDMIQAMTVEEYHLKHIECHSVGGVIGTHIGPNATACTYLSR